jgi:hypothetical protein
LDLGIDGRIILELILKKVTVTYISLCNNTDFFHCVIHMKGAGIAVSILTRLQTNDWGSVLGRAELLLLTTISRAHSASYPVGTRVLSSGIKQLGHKPNHLPPSSAQVKSAWSYTSTASSVCMV